MVDQEQLRKGGAVHYSAVEQTWHMSDSRGQILAFQVTVLEISKHVPPLRGSGPRIQPRLYSSGLPICSSDTLDFQGVSHAGPPCVDSCLDPNSVDANSAEYVIVAGYEPPANVSPSTFERKWLIRSSCGEGNGPLLHSLAIPPVNHCART